ncbi:disease resistance protein At4g27190-like [Eucalyptus grandis]|uniref:disease resistance protein At4g27190-like n=1 Tax=Eucalyptus grandis TaxID=71139 RepID=UPI00192EC7CF|nr:disease resistance protein At4g27190-like [Eucalyptus grandis]
MGGVGKSTLLADAERRIRKEKSFDWVAKADVSENQDVKRIQGEIAHALDLDIKDVEYVNSRAERLRTRLEDEKRAKKKVLIILDNLWKGLDLKSVGIPCRHDNKVIGCKLLLTSRFQDVLRREMGCDRDFRLEELKDEEAKRLFEGTVGDKVHDDPFKSLVDEALHKCAGLPFLIIAMANIFKDADFYEWKDVLRQIEKSTNKGISESINKMLQLSYDRFKGEESEEVKSLLRLCVVYGVSKPSLENLVRYSAGSRLFREDSSMEEVRNRLRSLIRTLKASSLLLVDDEDVDGFKIHDLVRGFVASVTSRDDPLFVLKDNDKSLTELLRDKLKSCTAVCFPYVDMKELPEELDFPEMRIFLLFTNNESLKVPDSYFNSMRKLMVLHLSQVSVTHSPSPFQFLENLHTLCLDGCSLENVAMIGKLKGLHILSFANSKIQQLPKEIGQLVDLRLLDLNHCSRLKTIEPGVLGSLMKLEELYMENSFNQWNAVEQNPPTNAGLIELNNMKNLCTLHASIRDPSVLPEDLNVKKLTTYKIHIGGMRRWQSHRGSSTLELELHPTSDILQKGCIQTLLGKTDDLFLDGSNGIEQSICTLSQEGFPKLKHLHVKNNPSVHYVLQSPSHIDFKTLELLILDNLVNLEQICNNHISSNSFNALKEVRVESCDKMEILFPLSLLRELPHLEEIRVAMCQLMREIVAVDDCHKVELQNMHVLELRDLPNMKNFFTTTTAPSSSTSNDQVVAQVAFFNGLQVSIPSLESLKMVGLPNLENIWTDESPSGLSNLQFLEVSSCKSLSKVINSRSLVKLRKLHTLTVEVCISVQEIFDLDGVGTNENIETLSELNTIYIKGLPGLRRIWSKNPCGIVRFHNLKKLWVDGCNNLRFLFSPSMVQSLAQLRELEVWYCKKMEAIIMEEEGSRIEISENLVFPMLTKLLFVRLESLTCFSRRKYISKARGEDIINSRSTVLFNQEVAFPSLETLEIRCLDNIEIIWDNRVAGESFHKLKSLNVCGCDKIVNIVPSCILGWLRSLESLLVRSCGSLEVVFKLQSLNPLGGHLVAPFPLKNLGLYELLELKCVWDEELHNQVKFHYLRSVTISGCKSLTFLFPALVAIHLTQLEELEIYECGIVELIKKEVHVPRDVFPRLTSLKLEHLAELKCIYTKIRALRWLALKTLKVHGCNKAEILFSQLENEMPLHKQPLFLIEKVRLKIICFASMVNIESDD